MKPKYVISNTFQIAKKEDIVNCVKSLKYRGK